MGVEAGGHSEGSHRTATLYVLFDDREETPSWLSNQFMDTGINIGLDEGRLCRRARRPSQGALVKASTMSSRSGSSTSIGLRQSNWVASVGAQCCRAMYGIAAVPRRPE